MTNVTAISRRKPAKPVTTAEVLDTAQAALATSEAIHADLVELMVRHMRHLMNLATIPSPATRPVLSAWGSIPVTVFPAVIASRSRRPGTGR